MTMYSSWGQSGGFSRRSPSRSTRHRICIRDSNCQRRKKSESQTVSGRQTTLGREHIPNTKANMMIAMVTKVTSTADNHLMQLTSMYLSAWQPEPGLLTVGEHLPQGDAKHPHVWGMREGANTKTLRCTPARKENFKRGILSNIYFLLQLFPGLLTMRMVSVCVLTWHSDPSLGSGLSWVQSPRSSPSPWKPAAHFSRLGPCGCTSWSPGTPSLPQSG